MQFLKRKLKNGMTVIMEKRELPLVSLGITNRFAAIYEDANIKGIAHLIEHMVFTGTKTRTHEDISREIEKKGGVLNAFTSNEVTSFWFKLPSEHVLIGLDILTDILTNPTFEEKKFEKEKKVVLEEIKMKHDDPASNVYDLVFDALYKEPFGIGIIGTEKTVSSLKRDFVFDYYTKNYNFEDFIVTIVGNADFNKICEKLEKSFKGNGVKKRPRSIEKRNKNILQEREGIDQAHFVLAMHAPLQSEKDYLVLEVLNAYLAHGMSSKLFLKIREDKGLAYTVRGSIEAEKNYSFYSIYAGTKKEALPEIERIIIEEFGNISKMSEKELEESKERVIGLSKVTSEESVNVMNELLFAEFVNKAEDYYKKEEKIRAVKLEDVKKLAKSIIKKYSTIAIVPKG